MKAPIKPGAKTGPEKKAPKNRATEISAARKAAFQLLLALERGQSHSDELLRGKVIDALSSPDRNLATALVLGVLRWQIRLDHQMQALLARPNAKLDPEIRIALRLGAFQILRMDRIPARAAIDDSVELAKQAGHRFASGMVNAVLRKLAAGAAPFLYLEETAEELALEEAHPRWLVERWVRFYGMEAARAICRHGQSQPRLSLRLGNESATKAAESVNSAKDTRHSLKGMGFSLKGTGFSPYINRMDSMGLQPLRDNNAENSLASISAGCEADLAAAGVLLEAGELLSAARTVVSGDATTTDTFREGRVRVQDEGSQLVAELAAIHPCQQILDACAAPGGKTLILGERHPAARIVALESSATRFKELQKRLAFLGERVECRQADATALTEEAVFDLVLADVPCSGTGTLGRNPEIRHRLRPDDLARQAERQRLILASAFSAVRPGGCVVYSTCSLEPEENEQVVAAVLAAAPKAQLVSLEGRIGALLSKGILTETGAENLLHSLTPEGFLRLLPGRFHTDGFFVALMERIA